VIIWYKLDYNNATSQIPSALKRGLENHTTWRTSHFRPPKSGSPQFELGVADFSPGWFMQRHEVNIFVPLTNLENKYSL